MKYDILKFEAAYGPPFYRVWLKRFPWGSWSRTSDGSIFSFETKEAAHAHMRTPARTTPAKPMDHTAPGRLAA